MGLIREYTKKDGSTTYRAEVRLLGHPSQRASFRTKTQAKQWIQKTESELRDGRYVNVSEAKKHTVGEMIDKFTSQWLIKSIMTVENMKELTMYFASFVLFFSKLGQAEVLKDLVTIASRVEYGFEGELYLPKSIPFISGFCFGSAVRKMQTMLASWNQKNPSEWMIRKRLCNAACAWNASTDIFEQKTLNLSTPILRKRANREKKISIDIKEMHALKTGQICEPDSDFSRNFSTICIHMLSKFLEKSTQNHSFF